MALRRQEAAEAAVMVMRQASQRWPPVLASALDAGFLDLEVADLRWRVRETLRRHVGVGGRAYIGSTSDPGWRWGGGRFIRSSGEWAFMPGHRLGGWRLMSVLGAWPDRRCAELEPMAIEEGEAFLDDGLANVARDARGLEIRAFPGYSFIYVCV